MLQYSWISFLLHAEYISCKFIPALPFSRNQKRVRKPLGDKYIDKPKTIGEHLRNRRLEVGLTQEEVAKRVGVSDDTIRLWELRQAKPFISQLPKIIRFLGYNPIEIDTSTLGGRIYVHRVNHGLSRKKMGGLVGVNASTIGAWEKGVHKPTGFQLEMLLRVLANSRIKSAGKG